MKTSLIIATYNQPEYLRLGILSVWEQTRLPDEIIIADDGSEEKTAAMVREMKKTSPVPILHTWQPNNGFRPMLARNNAVAVSSGEYLVFLDGDCFVNKHFIEDHLYFAAKDSAVCGVRVHIREKRKEYILRTDDRHISFFSWGTSKRFYALRSHFLAGFHKTGVLMGANFACWRSDFEKVNGFNDRFAGYCGEDYELACRLMDHGVTMRKMAHLGIAYHFDHPKRSNNRWEDKNSKVLALMQQVRSEEKGRCRTGLNRALDEGVLLRD